MKHSIFKLSRFSLVVRKYFYENGRTTILRLITLLCTMVLIFSLCHTSVANDNYKRIASSSNSIERQSRIYDLNSSIRNHSNQPNLNIIIFGTILLIAGSVYAGSTMMEHTDTKAGRISLYSQPSSNFEKYFIRWLTAVPLYLIIYALFFVIADIIGTWIAMLIYPDIPGIHNIFYDTLLKEFFSKDQTPLLFISLYFGLQSAFMLGSAVFQKNALVKTFVSVAIIAIISFYILNTTDGAKYAIQINNYIGYYRSIYMISCNIATCVIIFLTLFNWLVTYLRFKENDVVCKLI